jgi:hypothetical protein
MGLSSRDIRQREEAAIAREHDSLKRDELKAALEHERRGYVTRGMDDRADQVTAQLVHFGFEKPKRGAAKPTEGEPEGGATE